MLFFSCSFLSSLGLWSVMKKKPQALVKHHMIPVSSSCDHWVTSVTTLPFTDLLASGICSVLSRNICYSRVIN